jgi:serine/threonine-protein kinase
VFPLELAAAERALGEIYLSSRQAANALKHLDSALDLERAMPQQNGGRIVSILQNLARAHELRGELDRATYRHHEALVYQDVRHEPQGYVETLRTLGRLYTQLKRYGEAARALETALSTEANQPVPDGARMGDMTCALADVYLAQGRLEAAADLYRRAVESEGAAPDVADRAGQSLREVEADIARHLETLAVAEQSWALLNRVSRPAVTELAFIRALEARTNYTLGRWDEAERILERLVALLRARRTELGSDVASPAAQALALLLAAQEAHEAGRADEAAVSFREAVALVQADPKGNSSLLWALQHRADEAGN